MVVAELVAGWRAPGASSQELAQAAVELWQGGGRGSKWIATRLGVHHRQVHRWLQRYRAGEPLVPADARSRRPGRVA
ncbi:MAG: helix-turn-helix domain-containing protein [Pseudonocardiaceae bacterium]